MLKKGVKVASVANINTIISCTHQVRSQQNGQTLKNSKGQTTDQLDDAEVRITAVVV